MGDVTLKPGDRVVDLAALARSSGALTGTLTLAAALWILDRGLAWVLPGMVAGGGLGFGLGALVARLTLRAREGYVRVVKLRRGAFGPALASSLPAGVLAGALGGLLPALILSRPSTVGPLVGLGAALGALLGTAAAYLATLPPSGGVPPEESGAE